MRCNEKDCQVGKESFHYELIVSTEKFFSIDNAVS